MSDDAADPDEAPDAYSLLSKPTLELTDAEVELVVADLRKRRELYNSTGKPDKTKPKAAPKAKATAVQKEANTALLLSQLKLSIGDKS